MTVEMTNEIRCPGCGRALRLSKEHAGKQIRCPACQQICMAPPALDEPDPGPREEHQSQADSNDSTWYLRPPDGPMYGPVHRSELAQWAQEGRITADCELGESAVGPWHPAAELFPALRPAPVPAAAPSGSSATYPWAAADSGMPAIDPSLQGANPFSPTGPATHLAPHRGGLILVFGLLGFVMSCPIFSLMAWVMGSHDLNEMRAGRMDRS